MLYPLAPPVSLAILEGAEGAGSAAAAASRLTFGPPESLLGMPAGDAENAADAASAGSGRRGAGRHDARDARRPKYLTLHERLLRNVEVQQQQREEERLSRRERRRQQQQQQQDDAATLSAAPSADDTQRAKRSREPASDVAGSTDAPAAPPSHFEPTCERMPAHAVDYQGRGVLYCKERITVTPAATPPSKLLHVFKGHDAGVQAMSWISPTAHLLVSGDLGGNALLWDVFGERSLLARFKCHTQRIRNVAASTAGDCFSTSSVDGTIRHFDTERCALLSTLSYRGVQCATHICHPSEDSQHLVLAGFDKRAVLFDLRAAGQVAKQWDGHTQAIMNLTYLDGGKRFLSTAEDNSIRTWDFRAAVPIKVVADVSMHAMPHCIEHREDGTVAAQSLDNKIAVFANDGQGKLTLIRERALQGHVVSGTACRLDFSKDGALISSGDSSGSLFVWNYKLRTVVKKFRAHSKMLVAHAWHPLDGGKIVTSSWDCLIKLWAA